MEVFGLPDLPIADFMDDGANYLMWDHAGLGTRTEMDFGDEGVQRNYSD